MRTISKILAGAFIATATTFGASALELSDFVLSYRPYGIAATQKALNGEYYYQKHRWLENLPHCV